MSPRYTYYFLAANPKYKHNLWWKKYITGQFDYMFISLITSLALAVYQIVQFNILLVQAAVFVPKSCITNLHRFLVSIAFVFVCYLNYSFTQFYIKNYTAGKRTEQKRVARSALELDQNNNECKRLKTK